MVTPALFAERKAVAPVGAHERQGPAGLRRGSPRHAPRADTPVIGVLPGKIITEHLRRALPEAGVDLAQDVIKLAVVERHGKNGGIAVAAVHGFGLKRGAIASSIGHDSHNIGGRRG